MTLAGLGKRSKLALRDEGGFTLPEMMVTIVIMIVVLFALYGIFDMSIRIFSFGNDKVESTENARVALERMEREIRAAYPLNPPASPQRLDPAASNAGRITFYNDLDGDGSGNGTNETISYSVSGGTLVRQQGANTQPLAPLGPGGTVEFAYLDKTTGAVIGTLSAANEKTVGMVRMRLVVVEESAGTDPRQELITNAALRNRGT